MKDANGVPIVAVNVGNSRMTYAPFTGREPGVMEAASMSDVSAGVAGVLRCAEDAGAEAIVVTSVNDPGADELVLALRAGIGASVYRIGRDLAMPGAGAVDPDAKTGQDRLLAALAAFELKGQACVVVDAGTAITVDFVDGTGVFQGGAIAPGMRMGLAALREHTAALPEVDLRAPDGSPFGKNTNDAMLHGVYYGARGLVRQLTERYAEAYEAYPLVVATGGDAELLFESDDLVERIVPDLVLRGVAIVCERELGVDSEP